MNLGVRVFRASVVGLFAAALLGPSSIAFAQTASQARAVQATLFGGSVLGVPLPGTTTILADTGSLPSGITGALQASSIAESVPTLLTADSLHAATIGLPDRAASEASLGSLSIVVAGISISADFVMARATAVSGSGGSGDTEIDGLVINGVAIPSSGARNQSVPIPGGVAILNEQQTGPNGSAVSALHIIIQGVADVVIASARAVNP